jgi:hypothetical protein
MYNPEEDVIPYELLADALAISNVVPLYKVYFDKDTGDIISISNEDIPDYTNSIDVEYDTIKEFLQGKQHSYLYKVMFVDQLTPVIVLKKSTDVNFIVIEEVPCVDHWDNMFTVENYPLLNKWGFQLRPDQKNILKTHNLNTSFEVFVVDKNNNSFLIRTIKVTLGELINLDRVYVDHISSKETDITSINIFVRKFFSTTGYQILYDTNS